ncbi:MAG TPA: sialate O-acetylesterase [Eudoraea sp.]|nr:sialate O-acetylesterase [Eudoraea sp.]
MILLSGLSTGISAQSLKVARIFSDHMVVQRNVTVPVWGQTSRNERVVVFFNGVDYKTIADANGAWEIELQAQPAGGPFQMRVASNSDTVSFKDIMVGDVWLCSGQSNMEWTVANSNHSEAEIERGNHPGIRHFKVPKSSSVFPEDRLAGGEWKPATSETVGSFTAVGYFFAREIQKDQKIPIGLLNSSWGGSRIEPWISAEDLGFEDSEAMVAELKAKRDAEKAVFLERLKDRLNTIPEEDPGMKGEVPVWADKSFDDTGWESMELPALWEQAGWDKTDGVFWFRRTFVLGKGMQVKDAMLSLGPIDDSDKTWVNGHFIGSMKEYNKIREYSVPAKYLREGDNIITVRVDDTGGGGGIYGDPDLMFIKANQRIISLAGKWKYKVGMVRMNNSTQGDNQQPTLLFNKMIHPILKFPIKGVLWYQGESNAGNPQDAKKYAQQFKTLIGSWRRLWNVGDFPFLYVQLANFMAAKDTPAFSNWALLREAQGKALELPNTAQAVIIDIGEAEDIHPRNKQDVGKRLALAAQKITYGKNVVSSGPAYSTMTKDGPKIILHFDHVGGGLRTGGDKSLEGFAIAGADRKFIWATAKIKGNSVEVSSDSITEPVAVRYAWADNPDNANLYNAEGLPASPFRTDHWDE